MEALTEVLRLYPGIPASRQASDQIAKLAQANEGAKAEQRNKRARTLYVQAQDFYKNKDYIPCMDRCEIIIASYGDLPEGQQAFALASEIKNNRDWLQNAADVMADRLGGTWLAIADSHLKSGNVQPGRRISSRRWSRRSPARAWRSRRRFACCNCKAPPPDRRASNAQRPDRIAWRTIQFVRLSVASRSNARSESYATKRQPSQFGNRSLAIPKPAQSPSRPPHADRRSSPATRASATRLPAHTQNLPAGARHLPARFGDEDVAGENVPIVKRVIGIQIDVGFAARNQRQLDAGRVGFNDLRRLNCLDQL